MSLSINSELIEGIAADLVVDESLIEKDWYAIQIIAAISKVQYSTMQLVFSGGTSLSKGYELIQRFSEDIDFKVANAKDFKRKDFTEYRKLIIEEIQKNTKDWSLADTDIEVRNKSQYFKCEIIYKSLFIKSPALRPHIKLEVTFESPALVFKERSLKSFVAVAQDQDSEVIAMPCVSPVETAADKLSALVWRVAARDRSSDGDDPTFVRHLYDLAALTEVIDGNLVQFKSLVIQCLAKDAERDKKSGTSKFPDIERLNLMLDKLSEDTIYKTEYEQFVLGMSYAEDSKRPDFNKCLGVLKNLVSIFQ